MKLCRYILAVFLSAQIILLGVGQTRILYRCIKCAKSTNNIFVRIETGAYNDGSCSCGAGGCACEGVLAVNGDPKRQSLIILVEVRAVLR